MTAETTETAQSETRVLLTQAWDRDRWFWLCQRCKRRGRPQLFGQAEAGRQRHERYHAAVDAAQREGTAAEATGTPPLPPSLATMRRRDLETERRILQATQVLLSPGEWDALLARHLREQLADQERRLPDSSASYRPWPDAVTIRGRRRS